MGKRKHSSGRGDGRIIPSAAALAALKGDDYPPEVKKALRLSQKGGRRRPRRCLACGKQALRLDLYTTYKLMSVGGDSGKGCVVYWTCDQCHSAGLTPELERKLIEACK
jgi:hypothetical protein